MKARKREKKQVTRGKKISLLIPLLLFFLLLLTLSSGVFFTKKGKPEVIPQPKSEAVSNYALSQSKLGIFYLNATADGEKIMRAGPKVIKVIDPQNNAPLMDLVREYKRLYPSGIVVMRVYDGTPGLHYGLNDDPEASAQDFFQKILQPAINKMSPEDRRLIDYLNGPNGYENTPGLGPRETDDDSYWYGRFWARLAELIGKSAFRPNVGSIYVGGPDPKYLEGFEVALRKVKELGGVWSVHGYTLSYTTDPQAEKDTSLHYRNLNNWLKVHHPEVADLPMILGEGGVDRTGNGQTDGWIERGSEAEYQNWLTWYDNELAKDPYMIGVTLFQSGNSTDWKSFNLEPIAYWLSNYLSGQPRENEPFVSPTQSVQPILSLLPYLSPTTAPSPTTYNLLPTAIPSPPTETVQPTTMIPSPTTTLTPTPTKTLVEVIITNPVFETIRNLTERIGAFLRTSLP